jgi:hypothetical protein
MGQEFEGMGLETELQVQLQELENHLLGLETTLLFVQDLGKNWLILGSPFKF